MSITGTINTDILILNYLTDYEVGAVALVNKILYQRTRNAKFLCCRLQFKYGQNIISQINKTVTLKLYQSIQLAIAYNKAHTNKKYPSIRLSEQDIKNIYRLSYKTLLANQERIGLRKLFMFLPDDAQYVATKIRIMEFNMRYEYLEYYLTVGSNIQNLVDNLLIQKVSFNPCNLKFSGDPNFYRHYVKWLKFLRSKGIRPQYEAVRCLMSNLKFLQKEEKRLLAELYPQIW